MKLQPLKNTNRYEKSSIPEHKGITTMVAFKLSEKVVYSLRRDMDANSYAYRLMDLVFSKTTLQIRERTRMVLNDALEDIIE